MKTIFATSLINLFLIDTEKKTSDSVISARPLNSEIRVAPGTTRITKLINL